MKISKSDVGLTASTGQANRASVSAGIDSDTKRKVSSGDRKSSRNKRPEWTKTAPADESRIPAPDSESAAGNSVLPVVIEKALLQQAQREARQAFSEAERWRERCEASEGRLRDRFDEIVLLTRMVLETNQEKQKQTTTTAYLQEQLREKEVRVEALERQVLGLTGKLASLQDLFKQMVRNAAAKTMETELHAERSSSSTSRFARKKKKQSANDRDLAIIRQSALFDTSWYLSNYEDVKLSGIDPALHYLHHGALEGRDPGPVFSTFGYLNANPDVAQENINPLLHFLRHGAAEGRTIAKAIDSE